MKEEKNVQINLSFDMVKKVLLVVLGLYFVISIITNIYIDASIGGDCRKQWKNEVCSCMTKGLKKTSILNKMSLLGDDSPAEEVAGKCLGGLMAKSFGQIF